MNVAESTQGARAAGPMLWLVLLIPALTVVAGISTVVIAVHSGSADAVIDPVRRTAQVQDRDLRADRQAAELGLGAQARFDPETGALRLQLEGRPAVDAPLHLHVAHPVRGSLDLDVVLAPIGDGAWLGRLHPFDASHDWNLVLRPEDDAWRLIGRMSAGADGFRLHPALPGG